MNRVVTLDELRLERARLMQPIGFVPTMGYLHQGHLSLVQQAKKECQSVVVSIYVNPSQFGPTEDFQAYPRDIPRDLALLESEAVDLVWLPTNQVMYPPEYQTWVTVEQVTKRLEGEIRPGHFKGVATIVTKLFNAVSPDKSYFGQKDAQQAVVIRRMAQDLNMPIEIVICPTVRAEDGLALSSRNAYLNPAERAAAPVLYRALSAAQAAYTSGEHDADNLRRIIAEEVNREILARLQYVSCAHPDTFEELNDSVERCLLSLAVYIGNTRLIDNCLIGK